MTLSRHSFLFPVILALLCAAITVPAKPAQAACQGSFTCAHMTKEVIEFTKTIFEESNATSQRLAAEFEFFKTWALDQLNKSAIDPSMAMYSAQATSDAMTQAAAIGTFMDAENQLRAQREMQILATQAHKDYQTSTGVCSIGTNVRGLAAAETMAETNATVLNRWAIERQTGAGKTSASAGEPADRSNRLEQFKTRYCDLGDNNAGMDKLCSKNAPASTANKDIDFGRTVDYPGTLDINFADANVTDDEQDIIALSSNLYGHKVPFRFPENIFRTAAKTKLLDLRSVIAKRSVAQSSFFTIAGLKSAGAGGTSVAYMKPLLSELGMKPQDIADTLGAKPSYDAQMEILTKKIYQRPGFFTDLYDKPANVLRKTVSMQAIGLMQDFDTLQSHLRTEAMLSLLLELEVMTLQNDVQRRIAGLSMNGGAVK